MTRRFARVLVWPIAGAAVTLAIAWSSALWAPLDEAERLPFDAERAAIEDLGLTGREHDGVWLTARRGLGLERIQVHGHYFGGDHLYGFGDRATRAGVPWLCLSATWRDIDDTEGGWPAPGWLAPRDDGETPPARVLPATIASGGFAANTAVWTLALLALVRGPGALRRLRRRRRGACRWCGYPRTADVCSECGKAP